MSGKLVRAALVATTFGAHPALADLKGPAELPPADYKGQQYVDTRGCVFLRAGYGGQVTWVPRVTRDRKQLCGYPPSGGRVETAEAAAPEPAAAPAMAAAVAPAPATVPAPAAAAEGTGESASAPRRAARATPLPPAGRPATAGERAAAAAPAAAIVSPGDGAGYRLACPAATPVAQRFEIRGGGSKVLCTRGDGSLDGATFPVLAAGSLDGHAQGFDAHVAAGGYPAARPADDVVHAASAGGATPSARNPAVEPPPGYRRAWKDDRLNPDRGKQTVQGVIDQDRIWTRTAPAELRDDWGRPKAPLKIIVRHRDGTTSAHEGVVVSTMGDGRRVVRITDAEVPVAKSTKNDPAKAPPAATGGGRLFVQVGSFGVAANAENTAARLRAAGLPVARGKARGGALTVIYAGPFASAEAAKAALATARGMGFGDARLTR